MALIRWRLVLTVEYVPQVRAAAVAEDLESAHVALDADMALVTGVVALFESVLW